MKKVTDASVLMKAEYSLEDLMGTKFAEGLTTKELGEQMAAAMGEKDPTTVLKIVDVLGAE
ncbi:hypothetical protein, partial [Natrialba sp. PRR66]|uniref:hypothetical protein n=1 Tax=Natrialba sp. PRR66 TaxID=3098146 RepID=UPI002B1D96D3